MEQQLALYRRDHSLKMAARLPSFTNKTNQEDMKWHEALRERENQITFPLICKLQERIPDHKEWREQ